MAPRSTASSQQIATIERTWTQDVNARQRRRAPGDAAAELAEATYRRERELIRTGASTQQLLDEARSARDQASSARDRARDMLARTEAERRQHRRRAPSSSRCSRQQRELAEAELDELRVTHGKYVDACAAGADARRDRSSSGPASWRSLARRCWRCSIRRDQYVQIYVPVADLARVRVGQRGRDRARQRRPAAACRARSASSPIAPTSRRRRSRRATTASARSTAPR